MEVNYFDKEQKMLGNFSVDQLESQKYNKCLSREVINGGIKLVFVRKSLCKGSRTSLRTELSQVLKTLPIKKGQVYLGSCSK